MGDGIVATIQTPFARVGFDSNRSGIGIKAQLAVLRRARFGRSSEELDREIEQLELVLGELEESVAESNARTEQARQERASPTRTKPADRKPGGRKPLPAHLPREQVIHHAAPVCACC